MLDPIADIGPGAQRLAAAVVQQALVEDRRWVEKASEVPDFWCAVANLPLEEVRRLAARRRGAR